VNSFRSVEKSPLAALKVSARIGTMNDLLLEKLHWRYATKQFDPDKKIPAEDWSTLEEALILTPSSYGMQPWKFFVITNQELKESLVPASYKQVQVAECSHLLVIAVKTAMKTEDVDKLIEATAKAQEKTVESLDFYKNLIIRDIIEGPRSKDIAGWAKLQSYIALGNFMTCAAMIGVDACPMEGFVPSMYDEALGLAEKGYTTAVLCPAGYRSGEDKYSASKKVRYSSGDLIEHIS